jgi:GMP synthase PP-ATPase subunit
MFDMVNLMESRNPMIRLVIFGKIKKIISNLKGQKISDIDRKVIRGLFVKHIKDFDEDFREKMRGVSLF